MASAGGPCFPPNFTAWQAPYQTLNQAFGDLSGTAASELALRGPRVLPLQTYPHDVTRAQPSSSRDRLGPYAQTVV